MKRWRQPVRIRYGGLRTIAAAYILLPLVVFFAGFLRWYIALAGIGAAGYAFYAILRQRDSDGACPRAIELPLASLGLMLLVMLAWTYLGGMNGCFYQSADWVERNAVFNDLIFHRWPVRYAFGGALVYYVGHWLPPALVGKLAGMLSGSREIAWAFGRMALWLWSSIGLVILALLLLIRLEAASRRSRCMALAVFMLFSGMDIAGAILYRELGWLLSPEVLHLEWWPREGYQFTSVTACLYWVFNQSIVPWIATMLFLLDADERNYAVYGAACAICGPIPLVGLAILMVGRALGRLIAKLRSGSGAAWCRAVLSPQNITSALIGLPIVAAYLLCSGAFAATADSQLVHSQSGFFSGAYWNHRLFIFYFFEVGVYLFLLWSRHRRDGLFYLTAISLLCIPYFHVGTSGDFCMRASLPGVFVIMVYCAECVIRPESAPAAPRGGGVKAKWNRLCRLALMLALLIGAATPCVEVYRGLYHVITERTIHLAQDSLGSFDGVEENDNFLIDRADEHFFYRYLAHPAETVAERK